ncbi:hypothetical protein RchiOBHm_Chr4g0447031 [Rosa chinensis]|uniref:Uncharacterized protein n=1 Tax=Rosa chinensis TaxID=74649 RepID=A0A2P6R4U0_ROSCH|nr:uncharacterized protein LOC112197915 [Rosa chinensis]PRQ41451.1 hypothetical protein RchiOBHm_Chr4g0447031 [Rosa chinensis]
MNRNKGKTKTKTKKTEKDEVEELLQAAQDDMLLGLSVDSHISRLSDVDRRFQALKLKSPTPPKVADANSSAPAVTSIQVDEELKAVLGDDLSTRFAALKASVPMPSSSSSIIAASSALHDDDDDAVDEDDEVEKLIRWAKDAARLDPSPPSDDEE